MSVVASDIEYRYSGGAANTDPNACLGGAISTAGGAVLDDNVANDLFDDVSSAEQSAGDVEYRGIYIKNANGSTTLQDARTYITSQSELALGVAVEAVSTTMATIANESTAPTSVSFTTPSTYSGGLALNSTTGLAAGAYRGLWVRRTIGAGAASGTRSTETIVAQGDTL
jgi:hypothetical protein